MSRSAGTGVPLNFMCAWQRRADWRNRDFWQAVAHTTVRTGRTKPAPNPGYGHSRKLPESHEYVCTCGHRGWSTLRGVLQRPVGSDLDARSLAADARQRYVAERRVR